MAAASNYEIRKILSFHIISQIGYIIFGLGLFTPFALAGAIYFTMHNMLAKTNAFLVSGHIHRLTGSFNLKGIGGIYKAYPCWEFYSSYLHLPLPECLRSPVFSVNFF
jgi:multicomponent Na+:H+ antiporter subunit D